MNKILEALFHKFQSGIQVLSLQSKKWMEDGKLKRTNLKFFGNLFEASSTNS